MTGYNKRTWLNLIGSDSTGSIVAYDGTVIDPDTKKTDTHRFLELSDCRSKIRLHKTTDDSDEDFLEKMELIKNEIELFINHLKK